MRGVQEWRAQMRGAPLFFLLGLLLVLWVAGGSSRADVAGQIVVRVAAWAAVIVLIFTQKAGSRHWRSPGGKILIACVLIPAVQLIPLPPAIWLELPGRAVFVPAAELVGFRQPWRPISLSPSATWNALDSLSVPLATFDLANRIPRTQHQLVIRVILALIILSCVVGILQFSGSRFHNPLINYIPGMVSGNFANRNHFALLLSMGTIFAVLSFAGAHNHHGRGRMAMWAAIGFFGMINLATGSRAGLILFLVAAGLAMAVLQTIDKPTATTERRRWKALVVIPPLLVLALLAASFYFGRAISLERAWKMAISSDQRSQALPVVWRMAGDYFPVGSGFGVFDRVFRIHEPDAYLQPSYLNHAHNDWLEIVLEGGIVAIALALTALSWAAVRLRDHWVHRKGGDGLGLTGGAVVLLTCLASATDYPARVPIIMAILALGATWLGSSARGDPLPPSHASSTLPLSGDRL